MARGHLVVTDHGGVTIDPYDPTPRYRQLAALLRAKIADGTYAPGDRMPSEKTLSQEHGLARETVSKAMDVLRYEGLVVMVPGLGWHVRPS
jgi:DNA-binding GntR family transcriptional regulator